MLDVSWKVIFILLLVLTIYIVIGGVMFWAVEKDGDTQAPVALDLDDFVSKFRGKLIMHEFIIILHATCIKSVSLICKRHKLCLIESYLDTFLTSLMDGMERSENTTMTLFRPL